MKIVGFSFTKIVIIQSLEPNEIKTGRMNCEYVSAQISESNINIPVEVINCSNYLEFLQILTYLETEASSKGEIPLLHVECHGDPEDGLEFENGSTLSWLDLSAALTRLNRACRFNLLAVFSACFGGYFLSQMGAINPAPCWCMIAPTKTIDPGEILRVFRIFYFTLFRESDVGKALSEISKMQMSDGRWFGQTAELWFERLVVGYIENHCTLTAVNERAKKMYRQLRNEGKHQSIGSLTRMLRQRNRQSLLHDYFDRYFMTKEVPENNLRFNSTKQRLEFKLSELRNSDKYVL